MRPISCPHVDRACRGLVSWFLSVLTVASPTAFLAGQLVCGFVINDSHGENSGFAFASGIKNDIHVARGNFAHVFKRQLKLAQSQLDHDERGDLVPMIVRLPDNWMIWV